MEKRQYTTIHLSEENAQEVLRKALKTFPLRYCPAMVILLSDGIPYISPKDVADTIGPYMLTCKEKNVAPFVKMYLHEEYSAPGRFRISSLDTHAEVRRGGLHKLEDIAARAIVSGARPHLICYTFSFPEGYARFRERLGTDHANDKIEWMSIASLVNKHFAQDSLVFNVGAFGKREKEALPDWIEMLLAYGKEAP